MSFVTAADIIGIPRPRRERAPVLAPLKSAWRRASAAIQRAADRVDGQKVGAYLGAGVVGGCVVTAMVLGAASTFGSDPRPINPGVARFAANAPPLIARAVENFWNNDIR